MTNNNSTVISESIGPGRLEHSSIELFPGNPYSASFTPETSVIGFAFDAQSGVHAFASDQRQDFYRPAHSFAYIPAGCDVFSESEQGGEYLNFKINQQLLADVTQTRPIYKLISPGAISIARELRIKLMTNQAIEELLIEHLLDELLPELITPKDCVKHQLSNQQLKTLDEFIYTNIDNVLSVMTMADIVNMSAGHFSRVFKTSTGVTPFDYIIQKRLSYARHLLQFSTDDISSVAFACGFSSHSHMTMNFKKHFGLTPNQLRI